MSQDRFFLRKVSDDVETELVGEIIAGHLPDCGLQLQTGGAGGGPSRKHAQLSVIDGTVWVEDLRSTNGTFVNGKRITARTQLRSNDLVRFDLEEFKFRAEVPERVEDRTVQRAVADVPASWVEREGKSKTVLVPPSIKSQSDPAPLVMPLANIDTPLLVVCSGVRAGERVPLVAAKSSKHEWVVGSDPEREIVFTDKGVSGRHAKIVNEDTRWKLSDQTSANGTFVNGKQTNRSYLSSGDRLRFGPVECIFQLPAAAGIAERISGSTARITILALVSFLATIAIILLAVYLFK